MVVGLLSCCRGAMGAGTAVSPLAPFWAKSALGRSPSRAVSPFSPLDLLRLKAAMGQSVPVGRPSLIRKVFSVFLLLLEKRNTLENVCILIIAPNLMKQISICFLFLDLQ
jgi:hypothetical protein